jgi:mono/diheme cytochrome c family protein
MPRRLLFALVFASGLFAQPARFTADNQLLRPPDYREWVFLSAGFGMTYGTTAGEPRFDNVYVNPEAYRGFLAAGKWPEGTLFALEIRASTSQGSINRGGHYQRELVAVEFEVKDSARFPGGWAYFAFKGPEDKLAATARPMPRTASCHACHGANGAVEHTFVQFYPTLLEVARRKGSLRSEYLLHEGPAAPHPAP